MNKPTEKQIEAAMELSTGFGLFRQCGNMKVATGLSNDEVIALTAALAVEAGTDVEELQDKIDGLTADLESAVNTAYFRGATEWTRLNYPEMYKVLHANHPAPALTPASSAVEGEAVRKPLWQQDAENAEASAKEIRAMLSGPAPTPARDWLTEWERTRLSQHASANALTYMGHHARCGLKPDEIEEMERWKALSDKLRPASPAPQTEDR